MTANRGLVSPSGAVRGSATMSGDVVTIHLDIDTSAGLVAAREALKFLDGLADGIRAQFGLDQ